MQYVGFFLVVVAIVGVIYGVMQQMKAKKILAAPFKKTGEVAANPAAGDAQGLISAEGAIQTQQPLTAPCSGQACLYYEIQVIRQWEKSVQTENGLKTEKGTDTITTNKTGSHFWINDGSGPVGVDARADVDVDLQKTYEQSQNVSWGDVVFGQFRTNVPHVTDRRTTGVKAVEKILPAQGNLFVMGKLAGGTIMKTDGMLGKLIASTKGREKLIGATKRNAIIGFVAGGLMAIPGGYFSIFGEPPVDNCANMVDGIASLCTGHITDDSGETYDWTVNTPGEYTIQVLQPAVKIPIIPSLKVMDSTGKNLVEADDDVESFTHVFEAGKYTINVRDSILGDAKNFKGGFSFSLNIKSLNPAPAASGSALPPAASGSALPAAPAKGKLPAKPGAAPAKKPAAGKGW